MTTWTRQADGRYTDGHGYDIHRERFTGSFSDQFFTSWWVTVNGVVLYSGSTLTAAKAHAEEHRANPDACWTPGCKQSATTSTPRAAISLPGDGTIPTCDRCHQRYAADARMAARIAAARTS